MLQCIKSNFVVIRTKKATFAAIFAAIYRKCLQMKQNVFP